MKARVALVALLLSLVGQTLPAAGADRREERRAARRTERQETLRTTGTHSTRPSP
ncbi:MAG TPA: hypothetical protein PKE47_10555 [Verrucomicrobiota bacterium]|nr:hypothetical protein [Verrucomicrobiota bacterium]